MLYPIFPSFLQNRVVLDPYARTVFNGRKTFGQMGPELAYGTPGVLGHARAWPQAAAAVPSASAPFDWEGDRPPGRPMEDLIIYEAHVRGFTADSSSGVDSPGKMLGAHLQTLLPFLSWSTFISP